MSTVTGEAGALSSTMLTDPPRVRSTGTRASRILGGLTLAGMAWLAVFGLVLSKPDAVMGESVRYLYIHVPAAWMAYASFACTAFCGVMYLWPRTRSLAWDRFGAASAQVGLLFIALCLVTGMLWGRMTWGQFWTWDARLTLTALLAILYVGYFAIRNLPATAHQRAKRSAIVAIIAFVDIPLIRYSVDWWRTLHQTATIDLDPTIDNSMAFTMFVGAVTFTLAFAWLMLHANRVQMLEGAAESSGLDDAIAARHAEARHEAGAAGGVA
jgi:heme exporter protein C